MHVLWARNPLDVDISIPAEQRSLQNDMITFSYIDKTKIVLEKAESRIFNDAEPFVRLMSGNVKTRQASAISISSIDTASSPFAHYSPHRSNILVVMAIARNMDEVAVEAGKIFYHSMYTIQSCLALETFDYDIKCGALQKYTNTTSGAGSEVRFLRLRNAAYDKASDVANRAMASSSTSQQVTEGLRHAYNKFHEFSTTEDQYRKILKQEIRPILHKAIAEARKESRPSSFEAAKSTLDRVFRRETEGRLYLGDTVQPALAGCRVASRHSVNDKAFKSVESSRNAADAVEAALYRVKKTHTIRRYPVEILIVTLSQ
jgi:hypothetical protein